jgi:hypothetical protein
MPFCPTYAILFHDSNDDSAVWEIVNRMENIPNAHDWIENILSNAIIWLGVLSVLLPVFFGGKKMLVEETLFVELDGMETISPFFCLAGAVLVYCLLFAYQNPDVIWMAVLQGVCAMTCPLSFLVITLFQLRMMRGQGAVDEILRNLKLKK